MEPEDPIDKIELTEAIDRIDPTDPIAKIDPVDAIEQLLRIDSTELREQIGVVASDMTTECGFRSSVYAPSQHHAGRLGISAGR